MELPEKIAVLLGEEAYETDSIGMSGSSVHLGRNRVLKVQEWGEEAENEYHMLGYLQGRLSVPLIYAHEVWEGRSYLLMSRCQGEMACSQGYMRDYPLLCKLLAEGLRKLWSVDISDCPSDQGLHRKLVRARHNIEHGLVDLDNVEPDTFGEGGFQDPAHLLEWLNENKPEEEPVFSHGDFCLPNLFGVRNRVSGYIDLGRAGVADRWCDIALCYRSLSHNYSGRYKVRGDFQGRFQGRDSCLERDDLLLFRELGMDPDWEKIRYYILMDELF